MDIQTQVTNLESWQYQILDESKLPDIETIYQQKKDEKFAQSGKWRWIVAAICLVVAIVIFTVTQSLVAGLILAIILPLAGFGITHLVLLSGANKETDLEVLPMVAELCNGRFVTDCQQILPPNNPLAKEVTEANRFDLNSMSVGIGGMNLDLGDGGVSFDTGKDKNKAWLEYGYGISGVIPNTNVPYGLANINFCRRVRDNDGGTETKKTEYVLGWIGVQLPMPSLEIRRRFIKGNALTRMFDKVDSKITDQNVLDMESEAFNQAFKVEVHDHSDDITVRRMFSPKIMDAFVNGQIPMRDNLIYRDGLVFILDPALPQFNARTATKTVDNMIYRSKEIAQLCMNLAKHAGMR